MNIKTKNALTALALFILVAGFYVLAVLKALSK